MNQPDPDYADELDAGWDAVGSSTAGAAPLSDEPELEAVDAGWDALGAGERRERKAKAAREKQPARGNQAPPSGQRPRTPTKKERRDLERLVRGREKQRRIERKEQRKLERRTEQDRAREQRVASAVAAPVVAVKKPSKPRAAVKDRAPGLAASSRPAPSSVTRARASIDPGRTRATRSRRTWPLLVLLMLVLLFLFFSFHR